MLLGERWYFACIACSNTKYMVVPVYMTSGEEGNVISFSRSSFSIPLSKMYK